MLISCLLTEAVKYTPNILKHIYISLRYPDQRFYCDIVVHTPEQTLLTKTQRGPLDNNNVPARTKDAALPDSCLPSIRLDDHVVTYGCK